MEVLVAVLVVLALAAILGRFVFRDPSGQVHLPRIVDDSIGMYVLRRLTGRPTDRVVDPFARFRRPSTVIGRRPAPPPRSAARGRGNARSAAPRPPVRGPQPTDAAAAESIPPAWSVVERKATGGRPFGVSILEPPPAPARSQLRTALQYGVLVVAVAIGGLAVGALAGLASGPNAATTTAPPAGSVPRSAPPGASSPAVSPR